MAVFVGLENISPMARPNTESATLELDAISVFRVAFFTGMEYQKRLWGAGY